MEQSSSENELPVTPMHAGPLPKHNFPDVGLESLEKLRVEFFQIFCIVK